MLFVKVPTQSVAAAGGVAVVVASMMSQHEARGGDGGGGDGGGGDGGGGDGDEQTS